MMEMQQMGLLYNYNVSFHADDTHSADQLVTEPGVEFPRSFEINNIDFGSNFTVRACAEIPTV